MHKWYHLGCWHPVASPDLKVNNIEGVKELSKEDRDQLNKAIESKYIDELSPSAWTIYAKIVHRMIYL